jgi:hypothetical protein
MSGTWATVDACWLPCASRFRGEVGCLEEHDRSWFELRRPLRLRRPATSLGGGCQAKSLHINTNDSSNTQYYLFGK